MIDWTSKPCISMQGTAYALHDGEVWECPEALEGPPAWDEEGQAAYPTPLFPHAALDLLRQALVAIEGASALLSRADVAG